MFVDDSDGEVFEDGLELEGRDLDAVFESDGGERKVVVGERKGVSMFSFSIGLSLLFLQTSFRLPHI